MGEASCAKKIVIEVGHSEVERSEVERSELLVKRSEDRNSELGRSEVERYEIGRSEVWAKRGWTSLLERSEPNVTN